MEKAGVATCRFLKEAVIHPRSQEWRAYTGFKAKESSAGHKRTPGGRPSRGFLQPEKVLLSGLDLRYFVHGLVKLLGHRLRRLLGNPGRKLRNVVHFRDKVIKAVFDNVVLCVHQFVNGRGIHKRLADFNALFQGFLHQRTNAIA